MKFCPQCEREYEDTIDLCPHDDNRLVKLREETDTLVGQTIDDRFQVIEKIGEGGMGSVYLAVQRPIGRKVALKVLARSLASDDGAVRRFFHEAKVVSKLRHPNTITMYDFGQSSEDLLYIAMEYMTGESLDRVMSRQRLMLKEIIEIAQQVCESLSEAHQSEIIHRDLKPENIFIDRVGSQNIVKVLDFGIAKIQGSPSNLTLTGMVFGTPAYMSPEQSQGFRLDHRADIYSLGVVLYEMICGQLPFRGDTAMKVAMAHILEPVPDPREHSLYKPLLPKLSELVMAMLAKDKEGRPESIDAVLMRLRAIHRELENFPALLQASPTVEESQLETIEMTPVKSGEGQKVAVRDHPVQVTPSGQMRRPTATGPQRPKEIFDTANYREYATAKYHEPEAAEDRNAIPEILVAKAKTWVFWSMVGVVLLSATVLLILFGPRTRLGIVPPLTSDYPRANSQQSARSFSPPGGLAPKPEEQAEGTSSTSLADTRGSEQAQIPITDTAVQTATTGSPDGPGMPPADNEPIPAGAGDLFGTETSISPSTAPELGTPPDPGVTIPARGLPMPAANPTVPASGPELSGPEGADVSPSEVAAAVPPQDGPREGLAETSAALPEPTPTLSGTEVEQNMATNASRSTVVIGFHTAPGRARIVRVDDGRDVCRTNDINPCQAEFTAGRDEIVVEISRRRYDSRRFSFIPDRDAVYEISLERQDRRAEPSSETSRFRPVDDFQVQEEPLVPDGIQVLDGEPSSPTDEEPSSSAPGMELMEPVTLERMEPIEANPD